MSRKGYRGWKFSFENLGSVGPGALFVGTATKKGDKVERSLVSNATGGPIDELASMLEQAIRNLTR